MDEFENVLSTFIGNINKEIPYDFSISFEKSCYQMLPRCYKDSFLIEYPRNTLIFLLLSEMGDPVVKSRFFIQNILAKNLFFEDACKILDECVSYIEKNINQLKRKHVSNVMFQSLFLLFHEIGHCILKKENNLRNIYSDYVSSVLKQSVNDDTINQLIQKQQSSFPNWIVDLIHSNEVVLEDGIKTSFSKIETLFLSHSNMEELLCDAYSIMTLFPILEELKILKKREIPYLANDLFRMINNMGTYLYYSNYVLNASRIPNIVTPITGMRIMIIYDAIYQIISTHYPSHIDKFESLNGTNRTDILDLLFDSEKLNESKHLLQSGSNRQVVEKSKRHYDDVMKYLCTLI